MPLVARRSVIKDGELQLRRVRTVNTETTGMRTVKQDDKEVCVPATIKRSIQRQITDEYGQAVVKAFTADGQLLPAED